MALSVSDRWGRTPSPYLGIELEMSLTVIRVDLGEKILY